MKFKSSNAWCLGLSILIFFIVFSEMTVVFNEYIFHRLGINRNFLLTTLWFLPLVASFVAAYYSEKHKLIYGLSYIILLPLLGALIHYINGELGGVIDFRGVPAAVMTFKIYLVLGSVIITVGTILGIAFSNNN